MNYKLLFVALVILQTSCISAIERNVSILPNAMDTGYNMRTDSQRISLSFGKDKHQDVEFYIYK